MARNMFPYFGTTVKTLVNNIYNFGNYCKVGWVDVRPKPRKKVQQFSSFIKKFEMT